MSLGIGTEKPRGWGHFGEQGLLHSLVGDPSPLLLWEGLSSILGEAPANPCTRQLR